MTSTETPDPRTRRPRGTCRPGRPPPLVGRRGPLRRDRHGAGQRHRRVSHRRQDRGPGGRVPPLRGAPHGGRLALQPPRCQPGRTDRNSRPGHLEDTAGRELPGAQEPRGQQAVRLRRVKPHRRALDTDRGIGGLFGSAPTSSPTNSASRHPNSLIIVAESASDPAACRTPPNSSYGALTSCGYCRPAHQDGQ
jgi:hypothetical protein